MSGSTYWGWKDLCGNQKGNAIGSELVEEGREKVHGHELVYTSALCIVGVVESWNHEADEVAKETNDLHPLATIILVVDQEGSQIVAHERDADVQKVPQPADHDRISSTRNSFDELSLEQFVAVEEDVIGVPGTRSCKNTSTEVGEGQAQRLGIVASNRSLFLGLLKRPRCGPHFVGTVVAEPEGSNGRNGKGNAVCPLCQGLAIWGRTAAVENQQQQDEDDLVEELSPALHQEGRSHFAATVQTVFASGNLARANSVFHSRRGSHGVFTANTDSVEEQRPNVANNPSVWGMSVRVYATWVRIHTKCKPPRCREHEKSEEHDNGVLNKTPSSTQPIAKDTNKNLANDDSDNLEVVYGLDPSLVTDGVRVPAVREGSFEEWL